MKKATDSGYARNLGNFEQLVSLCRSYGALYDPSPESITVHRLQEMVQTAQQALSDIDHRKILLNEAINQRATTFKALRPLSTRVLNAFAISGAGPLAIADLKGFNRKIQGRRASTAKQLKQEPGATAMPSARVISASQTSFDFQVEHLVTLIHAVANEPAYQPNEVALTKEGLEEKLVEARRDNTAVIEAYTHWASARRRRETIFEDPLAGLTCKAAFVKKYLKATFGTQSPEYKQAAGIAFRKSGGK